MNNNRRKELKNWIKKIEGLKSELESIQDDEQDYFDGMPENLQGSINGMNSEEALDKIDNAISCIEDAVDAIGEIV